MPDDPFVAYCGKGLDDVLTILICIDVIAAKLSFNGTRKGTYVTNK